MERMSSLTIPDYGLKTDDIKYFSMESVVRGRGADRLKYLDLQGESAFPFLSAFAQSTFSSTNVYTVVFRNLE